MATLAERERGEWPYKMKDLTEASGLPRQAIHFYIQQGLLPPGHKTGRNMAWYSEAHLQRLLLIKRLQHERFLPLKAIRAILDGREERFTPAQHRFLQGVKERLGEALDLSPPLGPAPLVDADELVTRTGVDREDDERAVELGLVGATRDPEGRLQIAEADAWMLELFGEIRRIGFTRGLGFAVDDLAFYADAMDKLFREEMRLLSDRLSHLPPDHVAKMIERSLPINHAFLTRYHAVRVRDFFGTMD
jgi:DNA-binding transcriptional MerR regulator